MAEFQEVMRQGKRMCKRYGECESCPIFKANISCPVVCCESDRSIADVERIIMDWAAAHPEPRYPTWEEWYKSNFPNVGHPVCPNYFLKNTCGLYKSCDECRAQPIPADIAQKLGIKPIEAKE